MGLMFCFLTCQAHESVHFVTIHQLHFSDTKYTYMKKSGFLFSLLILSCGKIHIKFTTLAI